MIFTAQAEDGGVIVAANSGLLSDAASSRGQAHDGA
jgi:hypothetical protein